jgi:hypothetical protein
MYLTVQMDGIDSMAPLSDRALAALPPSMGTDCPIK